MTGSTTQGAKTLIHPVKDLETAKAVYIALLGISPQTDYWHVSDIEAKLVEVIAAGATLKDQARDVGGGRLVATISDPDGNVLGLIQDQ